MALTVAEKRAKLIMKTKEKIRNVIKDFIPEKKQQTAYINKHFVSPLKRAEKMKKLSYVAFKKLVEDLYDDATEVEAESEAEVESESENE